MFSRKTSRTLYIWLVCLGLAACRGAPRSVAPTPTEPVRSGERADSPPARTDPEPAGRAAAEPARAVRANRPDFQWPVSGEAVRLPDTSRPRGILLQAPAGTVVRAAASGTVSHVTSHYPGVGPAVVLAHPGRIRTFYGPLSLRPDLREGQTVQVGEALGRMVCPGAAPSAARLRFRILVGHDDVPDVAEFLKERSVPRQ